MNKHIIDGISRELEQLDQDDKPSDGGDLDAETLSSIDTLHFCGNLPILKAIQAANLSSGKLVLDINSGVGGPARMLAHSINCRVDALVWEPHLYEMAQTLTRRCRLEDKVQHILQDSSSSSVFSSSSNKKYDGMVSFMGLMQIKDRRALFQNCAKALKDGGRMYVEDFVAMGDGKAATIPDNERDILAKEFGVTHDLATVPVLLEEFTLAGFEFVEARETTAIWVDFCSRRINTFSANMDRHERVYGKEGAHGILKSYQAVQVLLGGGHLGGISYTVQKTH